MTLSRYSAAFEPDDLATLQRVFERIVEMRGLTEKDADKVKVLAAEMVLLFNLGVTDEDAMLKSLSKGGNHLPMVVTIRRVGDETFSVDWVESGDSVTIRVAVPQREGLRTYADGEREEMACKKAQILALDFAEALVGEKCVSIPAATN